MASIDLAILNAQVIEAYRLGVPLTVGQQSYLEQLPAQTRALFGAGVATGTPPEFLPVPLPTNSQHPSAINPNFAVFATGLPGVVGVHRVEPWGLIPIGTSSLTDAFAQGYRYLDGRWINTGGAEVTSTLPVGLPTGSVVPSGSNVPTSTVNLPATAIDVPFAGGPLVSIRMTTGIGADNGALGPVRFGDPTFPRIIMDERAT